MDKLIIRIDQFADYVLFKRIVESKNIITNEDDWDIVHDFFHLENYFDPMLNSAIMIVNGDHLVPIEIGTVSDPSHSPEDQIIRVEELEAALGEMLVN